MTSPHFVRLEIHESQRIDANTVQLQPRCRHRSISCFVAVTVCPQKKILYSAMSASSELLLASGGSATGWSTGFGAGFAAGFSGGFETPFMGS